MKCIVTFALIFTTVFVLLGQTNVDSLEMELARANTEQERIDLLNRIAYELTTKDHRKALIYAQKALAQSKDQNYARGTAQSLYHLGRIYDYHQNRDSAILYFREAYGYAAENQLKKEMADALNSQGVIYAEQGRLDSALQYYLDALRIFTDIDDERAAGRALNNIGSLHARLGEYDKALGYYKRHLDISKQLGDKDGMASTYVNRGSVFVLLRRFEEAEQAYQKALDIVEQLGDKGRLAATRLHVGSLYAAKGHKREAEAHILAAAGIFIALKDKQGLAEAYFTLADMRANTGAHEAALDLYRKSLALVDQIDSPPLRVDIYRGVSQSYAALGRYEEAYHFAEAHQSLQDSLFDAEKARQMTELEAKFENEKQQLEIARLEKENVEKDLKLSERRRERNTSIAGTLLLLLLTISFYVVFRLRQQKRIVALEQERSAQLQHVDQLKNQFLANTSHELRTPLQGIIGLAEGMTGKIETPELQNQLSMIVSSGRRLNNLVNDILDFSRLRHADIQLRRNTVDMRALADIVIQTTIPLADGKNLELINDIPKDLPPVDGDDSRLQQVLFNLIGNAIKFTEKGYVRLSARQDFDNMIRLWVEDTGIGISDDKRHLVFEPFGHDDTPYGQLFPGTGLGLTISKQLIELHGGKMWVHSDKGLGSIFYFTLPQAAEKEKKARFPLSPALPVLQKKPVPPKPPAAPVACKEDHPHILLVDDEPVCLQVLRSSLEGEGFHLISAGSGEEALRWLHSDQSFDLVILDLMMPHMSGIELCQEIRKHHTPSDLPVILVTAKTQVSDLVAGLSCGANDYLDKPYQRDELRARVSTQLDLRRINRAARKFVPNEFLRALGKEDITQVRLGDQTLLDVTVLFADIRGYTTLAENMSPEDNFNFIITFDQIMGPIIQKHEGFVNQYLGDGIMAIFPRQPSDALKAAIAMQNTLRAYNRHRRNKRRRPIRAGIGMHSGPLVMGIIGDEHRMEAATLSDAVNTAARVESLSKYYGAGVLLSEDSLRQIAPAPGDPFRYLGQVQVKGKKHPIGIYECFNGDPPASIRKKMETRAAFEAGLNDYLKGHFSDAVAQFSAILRTHPEDRAARLFLERSREYLNEGIPSGWTGILTMHQK